MNKNRYVLNSIINCICFCDAFELALRGLNKSEDSEFFREFISYRPSSQVDNELNERINKSSAFTVTSKTIQNDLLECTLKVYHDGDQQCRLKSSDCRRHNRCILPISISDATVLHYSRKTR